MTNTVPKLIKLNQKNLIFNNKIFDLYNLFTNFIFISIDLLVADKQGKNHQPKEWFIAPLQVIQQAVELLVNGQIMSYQYNKFRKEIELR